MYNYATSVYVLLYTVGSVAKQCAAKENQRYIAVSAVPNFRSKDGVIMKKIYESPMLETCVLSVPTKVMNEPTTSDYGWVDVTSPDGSL